MLCDYQGILIFISHDRRFRQNIAGRTLTLKDGRLLEPVLTLKKETGNNAAQIMLLEMKARALIEKKRGAGEAEQEKLEEYRVLMDEISRMKSG